MPEQNANHDVNVGRREADVDLGVSRRLQALAWKRLHDGAVASRAGAAIVFPDA